MSPAKKKASKERAKKMGEMRGVKGDLGEEGGRPEALPESIVCLNMPFVYKSEGFLMSTLSFPCTRLFPDLSFISAILSRQRGPWGGHTRIG